MTDDVRRALERVQQSPPPWRHSVDDFVMAGRRLRRRRRVRVAAGSSALAAVATGTVLALPSVIGSHTGTDRGAGPATVLHSPDTSASSDPRSQAFLSRGYDSADAVLLSRLWGMGMTPQQATQEAGGKLLAGIPLPITHGQTPATVSSVIAQRAFFDNGYSYDDAARLATLWNQDVVEVKTTGGRQLLSGARLPITPAGAATASPAQSIQAYARAGYDHDDAVLLSRLWGRDTTPYQATVRAGSLLLDGSALPVRHGQTAAQVSDETAREAYAANGYDYTDAVRLAQVWNQSDPYAAKATAGRALLAGQRLPVDGR